MPKQRVDALIYAADVSKRLNDNKKAIELLCQALAILGDSSKDEQCGIVCNNLGSAYFKSNQPQEALKHLLRAKAIKERLFPNEATLANTYSYIGICHRMLDDVESATEYQTKALAIRELKAPNSPQLSESYKEMGRILSKQKEYPQALVYYEKSLSILRRHPNLTDLISTLEEVADVNVEVVKYRQESTKDAVLHSEKAIVLYEECLAIFKKLPNLGEASRQINFQKTIADKSALTGKKYLDEGDDPYNLNALKYALKTIKIHRELNITDEATAIAHNTIGNILYLKGDIEKATEHHNKALEIIPTNAYTATSRDFIYEQETKGISHTRIEDRVGAKLVAVSQNEEGVLRFDDNNYEGLLTYNLQTCSAVIISDKAKGIHILQHHDSFTDPVSITDAITREGLSNPEITIVYNGSHSWCCKQIRETQDRIIALLQGKNIKYNEPFLRIKPSGNKNGGVIVTKNGEIDIEYSLVKTIDYTKTTNIANPHYKYALTKDYIADDNYTASEMLFEPHDYYKLLLSENVAKQTYFGEMRTTFLRYNGKKINDRLPTLPPKMENYFRKVQQEESITTIARRISIDRMAGEFEIKGDVWFEKTPLALDNTIYVFHNLTKILRDGCLPPLGSTLSDSGKTTLFAHVDVVKEQERKERMAQKYREIENARDENKTLNKVEVSVTQDGAAAASSSSTQIAHSNQ